MGRLIDADVATRKKRYGQGFFLMFQIGLQEMWLLRAPKSVKLSNYCPNCGARMDGDENA